MTRSTLLLLADPRFPAGTHAHSGGLEAAAAAGRVYDTSTLNEFLIGRLHTIALVSAAFTAAAWLASDRDTLQLLDHEHDVRVLSPALRSSSRTLGGQLLRAAGAAWPGPRLELVRDLHPEGAHQPIVLGCVAAAAGLAVEDAASCSVQGTLGAPAAAATRLLGLDPYEVARILARLAPSADRIAAKALTQARMATLRGDPGLLPALGSPLVDLAAEEHVTWEVRSFAS